MWEGEGKVQGQCEWEEAETLHRLQFRNIGAAEPFFVGDILAKGHECMNKTRISGQ